MAIEVTFSNCRPVSDLYGYLPNVIRLKNGDILAQTMWGEDRHPTQEEFDGFYAMNEPTTESFWKEYADRKKEESGGTFTNIFGGHWARSTDGGQTFTNTGLPPVIQFAQLENGDVIVLQWYSHRDADGNVIIRSWRSHDNCRSWDAPYDIPVTCPPLGKTMRIYPHRRILHLHDDTYLVLAYGNLQEDIHNRSMIFRTTDGFRTLHYYANVGIWQAGMGHPQGLNETDITRTPDGRLLAVMRNQSFFPMYQAHSSDNGASWTPAQVFPDSGVDPALCTLENGVVVCSYGRPDIKIACSEDNGDHWQDISVIFHRGMDVIHGVNAENKSHVAQRSCCYTDILATGPDTATVFYCIPRDWSNPEAYSPWSNAQRKHFQLYAIDAKIQKV